MNNELWSYYQQTVFALSWPVSTAFNFAIVTAFNPKGKNLAIGQNQMLDNELQEQLQRLNIPAQVVYGCSPDLTHWEKSWALFTDQSKAIRLAKDFNQLAIYWVEAGELLLIDCINASNKPVSMGRFQQRLLADVDENHFSTK